MKTSTLLCACEILDALKVNITILMKVLSSLCPKIIPFGLTPSFEVIQTYIYASVPKIQNTLDKESIVQLLLNHETRLEHKDKNHKSMDVATSKSYGPKKLHQGRPSMSDGTFQTRLDHKRQASAQNVSTAKGRTASATANKPRVHTLLRNNQYPMQPTFQKAWWLRPTLA